MSFYDNFKQYILADKSDGCELSEFKHAFFRLDDWYEQVQQIERELRINIPIGLKELYKELGYGFLCSSDFNCVDRIMYPIEIVDFYLRRDVYEYNEVVDEYDLNDGKIVFFEIDSDMFLTVSLHPNENGKYPVYSFDKEIAISIQDFIIKMDKKTDYYLDCFADK